MRTGLKVCVTLGFVASFAVAALATPAIDSAIVKPRIWNDDSTSVFTSSNLYPASLWMQDASLDGGGVGGWANRHNFRLSANGGISEAVFMNEDGFTFATDVTLSGTANIEGGLNVSPWWSHDVDGVFMLRTSDGEISCWGGRLPFYNFTASHTDPYTGQGVRYTKGTTARLEITYDPHSLTQNDPGTIQYTYTLLGANGYTFQSPVLPFDQGNPNEPQYGFWGILHDARVGGFFMPLVDTNNPDNWGRADFGNMYFVPEPAGLLLLGLALVLRKR